MQKRYFCLLLLSLPLRGCGLKCETWRTLTNSCAVTPLAGVWIEIVTIMALSGDFLSLPLRGCGLKYFQSCIKKHIFDVTPLAGVWIEIGLM